MYKKMLTLEDLMTFCRDNNFAQFDAKDSGYKLCVQSPAQCFTASDDESMFYAKVYVFHTDRNRNGSNVTEDAAQKSLSTFKYKPILADIVDFDGEPDFTSHTFIINDDGEVEYIEKQVGCFTADEPFFEEYNGKNFVVAYAAIPKEYTKAVEIIERKGGTKVSCELAINKMSYDAKKDELLLEDIELMGVTLLGKNPDTGKEVNEGMTGANLKERKLEDFSADGAPIPTSEELENRIKSLECAFDEYKKSKEGGVTMFEELLEKYGKTAEDIEFDYENLSDEELESAFAEAFDEDEDENEDEDACDEDTIIRHSVAIGEDVKEFSVSLNDKVSALCGLVNATYGETDDCWYCVTAYEDPDYVIMVDGWDNRAFKQSYSEDDGAFMLVGDREEVFCEYVTKDEKDRLEVMRNEYDSIKDRLSKYEAEPDKIKVLESEDYKFVCETEEYQNLMNNHFDLSVDEVKNTADSILLQYVKDGKFDFAEKDVKHKKMPIVSKKSNRYGTLFSK